MVICNSAPYNAFISSGGRLIWAAVSDVIGRRNTFMIFTTGSIPLYFFLPSMVDSVVTTGSSLPLYGFCVSTALAISMMGGVYAILPAYEADLFGTKYVGAVHGRMMLFSSLAALAGAFFFLLISHILFNYLRRSILFALQFDYICFTQAPPC